MNISIFLNRILGLLWFLICLVGGTFLMGWSFNKRRDLAEMLFPITLVLWSTVFLVGRALLGRIFSRVIEASPVTEVIQAVELRTPARDRTEVFPWPAFDSCAPTEKFEAGDLLSNPFLEWTTLNDVAANRGIFERRKISLAPQHKISPETLLIHSKIQKNPWTGFRVSSSQAKILQGVFTASLATDAEQVDENEAFIQDLLKQLAEAANPRFRYRIVRE